MKQDHSFFDEETLASISEIAEVFQMDRKTVTKRLKMLKAIPGPNGSLNYCYIKATAALFSGVDPKTGKQKLDSSALKQIKIAVLRSHLFGLSKKLIVELSKTSNPQQIKSLIDQAAKDALDECSDIPDDENDE